MAGGEKHNLSSTGVQVYRRGTTNAAAKDFRYRILPCYSILAWSRARIPARAPRICKTLLRVELSIPGEFMVPDFLLVPCKSCLGTKACF